MTPSASPPAHSHADLVRAGLGERDTTAPFVIGIVIALILHASLAVTTRLTPPRQVQERITVALVRPPPPASEPPPPPPPPEPEKPPPPPNETPPETPPPEQIVPIVTGISMSSTVAGESGMKVRVGNTTFGDANKESFVDPNDVKPYAGGSPEFKAARASTITKEAKVIKDYKGPYPRELAEQGVEGVVVLLVEINKAGVIGSVRVAKSCGSATLDRLAQEYMKRFRFAAAEVNGEAVDSILRYTYRFELYE